MPDIAEHLKSQVEKNDRMIQELESIELFPVGSVNDGGQTSSTVDLILKYSKEAIEQIARMQLFYGVDIKTKLEGLAESQRKGWLSVHDSNISRAFARLPPSSVIGLMLDSPSGKNFVFSLMADMSVPIYVVSTSMGRVQIEEMIASKVMTSAIYLDVKSKIQQSLSIDESDEFILPMEKAIVFFFLESGRIGNDEVDFAMIDQMKKKFTPPNGYLFFIVEKNFFPGSQGASLLSYISNSVVNTVTFREEQGGKFIELSGFYSSKTYQLRLQDDISVKTKVMGRDYFV